MVARTRSLFPNATVSIIGCFGEPWETCAPHLKEAYESKPRLFDAVTIHQYGPTNGTITRAAQTDALQRVATLAAVGPSLRFMESYVASGIAPSVPIWLDEFNW